MELQGRKILVTGANSGIGFEIARLAIAEGAQVFLHGRDQQKLDEASKLLGPEAVPLTADMASVTSIERMAVALRGMTDRLDGIVINAGIGTFLPLSDMDEARFDMIMDTNFKGGFFTIRALRGLLSDSASIVFNGSAAADKGIVGSSVYAASKAAMRSLTRTLAAELAPAGVRVNIVNPGTVATTILDKQGVVGAHKEAILSSLAQATVLKRMGSPNEVAAMFIYLLSSKASFITGSAFAVDGGFAQI